jgi:hypothetical protein
MRDSSSNIVEAVAALISVSHGDAYGLHTASRIWNRMRSSRALWKRRRRPRERNAGTWNHAPDLRQRSISYANGFIAVSLWPSAIPSMLLVGSAIRDV